MQQRDKITVGVHAWKGFIEEQAHYINYDFANVA